MSEERRGAASAIGFRRDVTWFLSALVGFFVILILILIALMHESVGRAEAIARAHRSRVADEAVRTINALPAGSGRAAIEATLVGIRATTGILGIDLQRPGGASLRAGDPAAGERIARQTRLGTAVFSFDVGEVEGLRRRLFLVTVISFASVIAGTILFLLYVRRIARPIERLLDEAAAVEARPQGVEETDYIIDAFRRTIANLREKEAELQALHDREKARADDLELVSGTLTRSLSSGFLALNARGELVEMNEAGRRILEVDEVRLGAAPPDALGATTFAETIDRACARREPLTRVEIPVQTRSGGRLLGLSTVPLSDESGRFLGLLALFTDLTPVRDLEARLRETRALADLGELAAGIAHEFRNSLSTIRGYLKLAARAPLPDEASGRLAAADQEAAQLNDAVTALLGFASPMDVRPIGVDLPALLRSIADRQGNAGGDVDIAIDCEPVEVLGDAALLSRAFENVVRNGIEAVQRGGRPGRVLVRCARSGDLVVTTVDDDGVGIDPAEIPAAFLPFRSGRPGGYGLGLALARKIVVLHGGAIGMEARSGGGVRVRVELPAGRGGS